MSLDVITKLYQLTADYGFLPVFARALGVVFFLPLETLPYSLGLRFFLALILSFSAGFVKLPVDEFDFFDFVSQFMAGFAHVLPVVLFLQIFESLADLIESLRGQNLSSILNPLSQSEGAVLPVMLRSLIWIIMLKAGVLEKVFSAFIISINSSVSSPEFWSMNLDLSLKVLTLGFSTALLFAFLVLSVEVGMLVVARLLPTFSTETLSFLLRTFVCTTGVVILLFSDFIPHCLQLFMSLSNARTQGL